MDQKRRELIYEKWADVPRAHLDGRTPREAASQEAYRVRVAAAVLLLEQVGQHMNWDMDFNDLRRRLGLPPTETIDPAAVNLRRLPLTRFTRLNVEKLSDDDLAVAYQRAAAHQHLESLGALAKEALRREALSDKIDRAAAHRILSQTATNPKEALEHLQKCREIVVKRGESPAALLLEEFRFRLLSGNGLEECDRILQRIRANHLSEPGVAQALYQTLVEFGIITPDGRSAMGAPPRAPAAAEGSVPVAPEAGAKLWAPGSPTPAAEEKKSKLWMPGMD
jgi:hypothetical protein